MKNKPKSKQFNKHLVIGSALTIEQFTDNVIHDLKSLYDSIIIDGNYLKVISGSNDISLPIRSMYSNFLYTNDYNGTLNSYIEVFNSIISNVNKPIDKHSYNTVFPLIQNVDFDNEAGSFIYSKELFLDLKVVYALDLKNSFRFIIKSDNIDLKKIECVAMSNLNKFDNILSPFDEKNGIYTLLFHCDIASSLLFSNRIRSKIVNELGSRFLFIIPSIDTLVIAKDTEPNSFFLKQLNIMDKSPYKISNKVYRFLGGNFKHGQNYEIVLN